jgi:integrase
MFSGPSTKRNILTPELATAVFTINWDDQRSKIANMLAAVTGMRAGEIQALRVKDIGTDCIYVSHSWNSKDSLKPTKNNEPRRVEVPFPGVIQALLKLAEKNPPMI